MNETKKVFASLDSYNKMQEDIVEAMRKHNDRMNKIIDGVVEDED